MHIPCGSNFISTIQFRQVSSISHVVVSVEIKILISAILSDFVIYPSLPRIIDLGAERPTYMGECECWGHLSRGSDDDLHPRFTYVLHPLPAQPPAANWAE